MNDQISAEYSLNCAVVMFSQISSVVLLHVQRFVSFLQEYTEVMKSRKYVFLILTIIHSIKLTAFSVSPLQLN